MVELTEAHQLSPDNSGVKRMITFKNFKGFKHITNILDFYSSSKELGSGSFGTVNLASNLITKQKVAIKIIKK